MLRQMVSRLSPRTRTVRDPRDLAALRAKSATVEWPLTAQTHAIIQSMIQVIKDKGRAAGLAAPQLGFHRRLERVFFNTNVGI